MIFLPQCALPNDLDLHSFLRNSLYSRVVYLPRRRYAVDNVFTTIVPAFLNVMTAEMAYGERYYLSDGIAVFGGPVLHSHVSVQCFSPLSHKA